MSEHIKALLEGQDLSEEFQTKATAIMEAAIQEATTQARQTVTLELQESFDVKTAARMQELEAGAESYIKEEVMPQIDKYLTAAVNEWLDENKVALTAGAKVELAESFLTGLVGLAESHNLNLPQSTVDHVAALQEEVSTLKESISALTEKNVEILNVNKAYQKSEVVQSVTKELTESQKDKLQAVVEKVEFKNVDQFTAAVKSLVESYFPVQSGLKPEDIEPPKVTPSLTESTDSYAELLMKQVL